jgi:hypothetical protein
MAEAKTEAASDAERINAFLPKRGAQGPCAACGQNAWTLVGGAGWSVTLPMIDGAGTIPSAPPNVPVYTLVCNNCGNLRLHASRVVDADDGGTT